MRTIINTASTDTEDPVSDAVLRRRPTPQPRVGRSSGGEPAALEPYELLTSVQNAACQWCRYLSCIPTSSNERCKGTVSGYTGVAHPLPSTPHLAFASASEGIGIPESEVLCVHLSYARRGSDAGSLRLVAVATFSATKRDVAMKSRGMCD